MGDVTKEKHFQLEVIKWEGRLHCCYLNNFRIAGGKPWAGGETVKAWSVPLRDVIKAIPELQKMSSDLTAALAREAALREELAEFESEIVAALPGVRFMDLPDGGSPTLGEQVKRMSEALTAAEQRNAAVHKLSPEAYSVVIGMVEHCLNIRACMGMDEGYNDYENEESEHDFVKEIREFVAASNKPTESGASE